MLANGIKAMVRAWVTRDGMDLRPCLLRRRVGGRRHGALLEDHEGGTGKKSFHQGWTCGRDRSPDGRVASDRRERRAAMSTNLPKPPCKLIGEDGNVFSIIGRVRRALTAAGQEDRA